MIDKDSIKELIAAGCNVTVTTSDEYDAPLQSVEVGPANCRYKLYFRTYDELKDKLAATAESTRYAEELGLVKGGSK